MGPWKSRLEGRLQGGPSGDSLDSLAAQLQGCHFGDRSTGATVDWGTGTNKMSSAAASDDQVSCALRHFRRRPDFVNQSLPAVPLATPSAIKSKHRPKKVYSGVSYKSASSTIILNYLHSQSAVPPSYIFLSLEVDVTDNSICVDCWAPSYASTGHIKQSVVAQLDGWHRRNVNPSSSLFWVLSQLLLFLSNELTIKKERISGFSFDVMLERLCRDRSISAIMTRRLLDLEILLLRCAAAGRHRSKICSPVPTEFEDSTSNHDGSLSRLVFETSTRLYMNEFRCGRSSERDDQMAWTLLAFLLSLPWIGGCKLASVSTQHLSNEKSRTFVIGANGAITVKFCLDIGTSLGDVSPGFQKHALKYGTVQAYHGTKVDNVWRLNYNLQNLSLGDLSQNGAMLGEGVYLSTSLSVADHFSQKAAEGPSRLLQSAFEHEALLNLLLLGGVDLNRIEPLDTYDIVCLPVFEACIIKPPDGRVDEKCPTFRDKKYYVVRDGEYIRLTKLHFTFELKKKRWGRGKEGGSFPPLALVAIAFAIIWMLRIGY